MNKIAIVQKFKINIDQFISELTNMDTDEIKKNVDTLLVLLSNPNNNKFQTIENENIILVILDNIHNNIVKLSKHNLSKDIKSITHEFMKLKKMFNDEYDSTIKASVQTFKDSVKSIEEFREFSLQIRKYIFLWPLYEIIAQHLLKSDVSNEILEINEENKNYILKTFSNISKKSSKDIGLKTYGLIPISALLSIDDVLKLVFKKSDKSYTFNQFIKLCKTMKTNLILIKKHVNNGIDYNILNLLDYAKSAEYSKSNNSKDGITVNTINRYQTIKYIEKKSISNVINYSIYTSNAEDLLILQEIWPNKYYIMSNKFDDQYILQKYNLKEFVDFVEHSNVNTRINDYNSIINKKIMKNMFLDKKYDIDELKGKSIERDPKYFRHEIKTSIVDAYSKLIKSASIKNIQDFSKIVLNKTLIDAFSLAINNFSSLVDNNLNEKAEMMASYIYNISINERDFEKRINDTFKTYINIIIKEDIFSDKSAESLKRKLFNIFNTILELVLNSIINVDNSMYQVFTFKSELLNIAKDNASVYI
jgi:hypothetical protein